MVIGARGVPSVHHDLYRAGPVTRTHIQLSPADHSQWWSSAFDMTFISDTSLRNVPPPPIFASLYGGQIAGQLLVAAAHTVDADRAPHAIHTSFVRPGDPHQSTTFDVEETRESRTLSTRHVRALQDDRIIAAGTVSFHAVGTGAKPAEVNFDRGTSTDGLPSPEQLPDRRSALEARHGPGTDITSPRWPVDVRYVDRIPWDVGVNEQVEAENRLWLRTLGDTPQVPGGAEAAIALATDLLMYEPVLFPSRYSWERAWRNEDIATFSIDHVLWFHRPTVPGEWLLMELEAPIAQDGRGFCRATLRSRDHHLVASVAQEMLLLDPEDRRPRRHD